MKKNILKNPLFYIFIFLVLIGSFYLFKSALTGSVIYTPIPGNSFAQCLTQKGAVMYGTEWCGFCNKQKDVFGSDFKNVNYVDCDKDKEECVSSGVRGYPTWKINGELSPGLKSLEQLSALSGCEL